MAAHNGAPVDMCSPNSLHSLLTCDQQNVLLIDSRTFLEFNTCNVAGAINMCSSKLVKRRLQAGKLSVLELLNVAACTPCDTDARRPVVVYDQCSERPDSIAPDSFVGVLLVKLRAHFHSLQLLRGGFLEFHARYPQLCEAKSHDGKAIGLASTWPPVESSCPPLAAAVSGPALFRANPGPTRILAHLLVGSEVDALDGSALRARGITHVLNVSVGCARSPTAVIPEHAFLRLAINDDYQDKVLPHLARAFAFIEKCRESGGRCLVHCLAGVSRSPTIAIAYVMRFMQLNSDDAYKFVKERRASISPNFNFLGQLLELDTQLRRPSSGNVSSPGRVPPVISLLAPAPCSPEAVEEPPSRSSAAKRLRSSLPPPAAGATTVASPTTALARLSFDSSGAGALLSQFTGTSLEKIAFTPCRAATAGAAPPTPPPPRRASLLCAQKLLAPGSSSAGAASAAAAAASRRRTHQQTSAGGRARPQSVVVPPSALPDDAQARTARGASPPTAKSGSLDDLFGAVVAAAGAASCALSGSTTSLGAGSSGHDGSSQHSSMHGSLELLQCS